MSIKTLTVYLQGISGGRGFAVEWTGAVVLVKRVERRPKGPVAVAGAAEEEVSGPTAG